MSKFSLRLVDDRFVEPEITHPPANMPSSGGGGSMDSRVAKLESDVGHIRSDISEIKTDLREMRSGAAGSKAELQSQISELRKDMHSSFSEMRSEMQGDFKWITRYMLFLIGLVVTVIGLYLKD